MEDYEEKYKRALGWMQSLYKGLHGKTKEEAEKYFPELKESEGERIRKALIRFHKSTIDVDGIKGADILAWFEKQGEHANFRNKIQIGDKVTRNEDGVLVNLSQLNRVAKKNEKQGKNNMGISEATKQELEDNLHKALEKETTESLNKFLEGEQKPADNVEPKFKAGDKIISTISNTPYYINEVCNGHYLTDVGCIIMFNAQDNFELVEQKPAEWSIFDYRTWQYIVSDVLTKKGGIGQYLDNGTCKNIAKYMQEEWSKKLSTEQKPAWGEEDEKILDGVITNYESGYLPSVEKRDEIIEKLKSLKERYTWKPSDEQMHYLSWIANVKLGDSVVEQEVSKHLNELLEDLKKLKG